MRIGFVNGCFDCFHEGHKTLLRFAATNCNYLIAAVNSDASVRRLKGEGRPIDNWSLRALNVRSYTRTVIPFEGDIDPLIMAMRPDVLIKGYDHSPDVILYSVRNIGWKYRDGAIMQIIPVLHAPHLPGFSTTKILEERGA